jgi:FkbM family methyltransferase
MWPSLLARLNAARLWQIPVRVAGNQFRPPTLDRLVALLLFRAGLMGRGDLQLFECLLRPGMTVVDVGANQGIFTMACADLVGPAGTVIAFEPDPEMFAALRNNVTANGKSRVELHQAALSSGEGLLTLRRSALNRGDNRLQAEPGGAGSVKVPVTTLDRMLEGRPVDLVKMDVQGWEGAVLKGMNKCLKASRPPQIHLEICPYLLARAGSSFAEVHHHLADHGYELRDGDLRQAPLDLERVRYLKGPLGYANVLAVPTRRGV